MTLGLVESGQPRALSPDAVARLTARRLFPILQAPPGEKEGMADLNKRIDAFFERGLIEEAQALKENSISRFTDLMGPWKCDFKCPVCYTYGTNGLVHTTEQTIGAIKQAQGMGAKVTYWPGKGELTLLKDFWAVMDWQEKDRLPAVVFTNGSIFHNDRISHSVLGVDSAGAIAKVTDYAGMHFYIKYWSSEQEKAAEMVGVKQDSYPYAKYEGKSVPLALAKLLDSVGTERVGVEVMVSRQNFEDVMDNVIPTILELGLYSYIEPIIFSGAAEGQYALALTPEQNSVLMPVYASGGAFCEKRQSTELILVGDKLTPGIAIPPLQENGIVDDSGKVRDLFSLFHGRHFRDARKIMEKVGCICRAFAMGDPATEPLRGA